jgi:hypothetical protein
VLMVHGLLARVGPHVVARGGPCVVACGGPCVVAHGGLFLWTREDS